MKKIIKRIVSLMICLCLLAAPVSVSAVSVSAPKISSVSIVGAASLKVTWSKVSSASGYVLYRKTDDGSYKKLATVSKSKTTYTNSSLSAGKKYTYKIRAYKTVSGKTYYSNYSNAKANTTVGTPKNLSVSIVDTNTLKIKWSKANYVSGYVLYAKVSDGSYKKIATLNSSTTTYTHKKLQVGKKYFYKVRAYKKVGDKTYYGSYSNVQGMKTTNYLVNLAKPYSSSRYEQESFCMGGDEYFNGFCCDYAIFNLKSKYSKMSFILGSVDDGFADGTLQIFSDNFCVRTINVKANDLPKKYTVNIENAAKLEVRMSGYYGTHIGIAEVKVYK
ncbi:MAG: fibronectin type III domain-containing protein [Acutalibacteraceae bacterium]